MFFVQNRASSFIVLCKIAIDSNRAIMNNSKEDVDHDLQVVLGSFFDVPNISPLFLPRHLVLVVALPVTLNVNNHLAVLVKHFSCKEARGLGTVGPSAGWRAN